MNDAHQLSLEQEFNQRLFVDQVEQMSHEQAQEFLVYLHKEMMVRENLYREILKDAWGLEEDGLLSDYLSSAQ